MVKQTAEQFLEEREWECKWGQGGLPLLLKGIIVTKGSALKSKISRSFLLFKKHRQYPPVSI